jgi:peroxiredoxin Q/BCP
LAASLRYADSGVSLSASTLRVTGTTRCSAASARKSSRDVVEASVCTQMILPDWTRWVGVAWTPMTPLKTGDTVAEFELPDQTGTVRSLTSLLADGPVVLFFYPAALTPGCTKEACHFRDLAAEFAAIGASRVGISTDPVAKQAKFADIQRFDYPLLSDADGKVASHFGVKRGLLGKLMPVKRTTFVIDTDRTVLDVISSEISMDTHADKALEVLRAR